MTNATGIHSHPVRKLGRKPDDFSKPKLDLTELAATADFSMVPATADYIPAFKSKLLMLGNGPDPMFGSNFAGAGDCEIARLANHRLELTGHYPEKPGQALVDWIVKLYRTQNRNFDPNSSPETNGPGSTADEGMSTDELLSYLHKTGLPDGTKVVAYGTINPTNVQAIERAIALFGSVWVDILVQNGNQTEFDDGKPWTNTGETPEGGHAVLGGGYTPQRRIVTWADEAELADSFWTGHADGNALVQRVYLVIWPEHATKEFIASVGASQLAELYQALTNKALIWPTPVPTPTPTPNPSPTPAPSGKYQVDDPQVVAHVSHLAARRGLTPNQWLTRHLEHYFNLTALDSEKA